MSSTTRREPGRSWSEGLALIKWCGKYDREACIAILYGHKRHLDQDYARVTCAPKQSSWQKVVRTAHLEKTRAGQPFLDLGWRCYVPTLHNDAPNRASESPTHRIYVPVAFGGKNRRAGQRALSRAEVLWLQFHLQEDLSPETCKRTARTFFHGILPCEPSTEPIQLAGLQILGTLIRPGGGYA